MPSRRMHSLACWVALTLCASLTSAARAQSGSMRVSLPSPSAAALGKFGDVPVSLATGAPEISIPIFTLRGRTIEVPITLRYHASGLRVEEIGGWVGMGWALEAGGSITRTVRGLADEKSAGYYLTGHNWWSASNWPTPSASTLSAVENESLDPEPDQFFFTFAGRSGQFVMGPTSASPTSQMVRTIPYQRLRIIPNSTSSLDSWEITAEDGTRYFFAAAEATTDLTTMNPVGPIPPHFGETFNTTWHLTKIKSPGGDSVTFHYSTYTATHNQRTYREKFDQVVDPTPPACVSGSSEVNASHQATTQRLDSIRGATHTVRFLVGASLRTDALSPTNAQQEPRLDRVVVTTPSGTVLREYQLQHDYSIGGRLTLLSVTEKDRNGNALPSYALTYQSGSFPARTSSAQDHFGYYNGKTAQTDLIPGAMTPSGLWLPGADREPDLASARVGSLTRITYPTGGYNEFVYELHDYGGVGTSDSPPAGSGPPQYASAFAGFNQGSVTTPFTVGGSAPVSVTVNVGMDPACGPQIGCPYAEIIGVAAYTTPGTYTVTLAPGSYTLHAAEEFIGGYSQISIEWRDWVVAKKKGAGGLRLAELRTSDVMGNTSIKRYRYLLPSDTTRSSGVVSQEPRYDYTVQTVGCAYFSRSTSSKTPLGGGPVVAYRAVTVLHGANGEFGIDEHTFRTAYLAPDQPISGAQWPGARATSNEWMRGQGIASTIATATGVVQSRTGQAWTFISDTLAQPLAVERFRAMSINSFAGGAGSLTAHNALEVVAGWAYLASDTTISFDETGANGIATSRVYRYENAAHGMLTRTSETAPGGTRRVTRLRYPADYASGSGDPEATALTLMNGSAHMPGNVIERVVEDSAATVRVLQSELTTYRTTVAGQTLPYQTFALDAPSPATGLVNSAVTGGIFTKDARYIAQETATAYDASGRILQLTDAGGRLTTYEYGGNPNAAFLTKVTRVKDAAGLADLVTTLAYNSDGYRVLTTDEGGRTERFAYDLFGRLTERRNHDSVLVASFAYTYSRTSANGWTFSAASPNVVTTTTWLQQTPTPKGVASQEWLDGLGRPIQAVVQGGTTYYVTATQYDLMGRPWRSWKPYSRATSGFDAAFSTTATSFYNSYHATSNAKPYEELGYATDATGRVKRETPAYIGTTATVFRTISYGTDVATQQRYTERADELNKRTRAYLDVLGSPARSMLGVGAPEATTTTLVHDAAGRRTQSIDPRGVSSSHGLSTRGLALTSASADAGAVARKFDRSAKLRYSQDANQANVAQVMFTTYDFADRVLLVGVGPASLAALDPDATSPPALETSQSNWLTVNAYDAKPSAAVFPWSLFAAQLAPLSLQRTAGRLAAEAHRSNDAWQATFFSYDAEGRVETRYQFTQDNSATFVWAALNTTVAYTYDLRGSLLTRALTVGSESFWQWTDYDDRGLLWKVSGASSATKPATADVTFTYRPSGELENRTFQFGPTIPFRYTIREQLERIGNPALTTYPFSARYAYHANGTISETEFYQAGTPATAKRYRYVIAAFNYDALNRMLAADFSPWSGSSWTVTQSYDLTAINYDASGNLTSLRRRGPTTSVDQLTYSYPGTSNRLASLADAAGATAELWDAEAGSFAYDANGNLVAAPGPYTLTGATYDPWNRPLSATTPAGVTLYRSSASGHRVVQQTGTGPVEITLREGATVLGGMTLDATGSPTAWHFNLLAGPRAVGRQPHTGSRRYYHADLLGSVRAVVTGATVVEATDYDPWGVVLVGRSLGTPGSGTREGFTSQPRDLTVGWDDFGARQYLAAYGRWGGVDPRAGVMPEWSAYAYVLNNPAQTVDPDGQLPQAVIGAAIGFGVELASQLVQGKGIDGKDLLVATAAGAATAGFSALRVGGSLARASINAAGNVAEEALKAKIGRTEEYGLADVVSDGTVGLFFGGVAELGSATAKRSDTGRELVRQARRAERIAEDGRPRPSQTRRAQQARQEAERYGEGAVAGATTASAHAVVSWDRQSRTTASRRPVAGVQPDQTRVTPDGR
ncbi:MAG: hypothetical protein KJZ74_04935 [Gemmatimonadales bacterium]|nr:hypothetical protein [Gemmatimonadales bacterium]